MTSIESKRDLTTTITTTTALAYWSTTPWKKPTRRRSDRIPTRTTTMRLPASTVLSLVLVLVLLISCTARHCCWTTEAWQPPISRTTTQSSLSSSLSFRSATPYTARSYCRIQEQQQQTSRSAAARARHHGEERSHVRLSALPDFHALSDLIQSVVTHHDHGTVASTAASFLDSSASSANSGSGGLLESVTSTVSSHSSSSSSASSSTTTTLATSTTVTIDDPYYVDRAAVALTGGSAAGTDVLSPEQTEALQMAGEAALAELGRDVLTFLAVSVVVVPLSQWLGVTPVLGFLAVGCLLGPNGLGVFANSEANLELGDFGILFLLFSEGLNLSPDRLGALRQFSALGVLQIIASMCLFFFGIVWGGPLVINYIAPVINMDDFVMQLFKSPPEAFCIAAAGALSSSAFIFPVIKAKKWEDRPEGISALSILLLQDVAVAPLLVILPIIAGAGPQSGAEVAVLACKATIGFAAVLAAGSFVIRYVFDVVAAARSTETFVAAALLVALGMGQVADYLGLSASTGAFAAGVLLAGNRYRAQIKADIRPFEGILLGIFFITAGAELDPNIVIHNLPILAIGIFTFILTKALVLFVAGPALGKTRAGSARVAITLAGGGEFSLVLFKLAQQLDVLPSDLADLLTASVIISMSLTPILGDLADAAGNYLERNLDSAHNVGEGRAPEGAYGDAYYGEDGWPLLTPANAEVLFTNIDVDNSGTIEFNELQTALIERGLGYIEIAEVFERFDTDTDGIISRQEWKQGLDDGLLMEAMWVGKTAEDAAADAGQVEVGGTLTNVASDAIVICGFTEFGKEMYEVLEATGATANGGVVAFELNPARVSAGIASNVNIIYGDGASAVLLRSAGVSKPRGVIVAYRSEARRLEAITRLRGALPPGTPIFARVISGQSVEREELIEAGATDVVSERTEAALRFGALVGALNATDVTNEFRERFALLNEAATQADPAPQIIPGIPPDRLDDLTDEFECSVKDMKRLYEIFSSVPETDGDGQYVNINQLRDVLLRTAKLPIDDDELKEWMEFADMDGGGSLSFIDFARVYFKELQHLKHLSDEEDKPVATSDSNEEDKAVVTFDSDEEDKAVVTFDRDDYRER